MTYIQLTSMLLYRKTLSNFNIKKHVRDNDNILFTSLFKHFLFSKNIARKIGSCDGNDDQKSL